LTLPSAFSKASIRTGSLNKDLVIAEKPQTLLHMQVGNQYQNSSPRAFGSYLNCLQVACRLRMIETGSSRIIDEDVQFTDALKTFPCPKTTANSKMSSKMSAEQESSI
jgi:hypothetical protein